MPRTQRSRRWLGAVAVLGAATLLAALRSRSAGGERSSTPETLASSVTPRSARTTATEAPPRPASTGAASTASSNAHEDHDSDRHPHPITPEHVRIQNDNRLLGALNDATDSKDVARLRTLVEVWRSKHDDDPEKFADAYTVIADCLEFGDEASKTNARRFYDDNRWSTLRRHIRRHCF